MLAILDIKANGIFAATVRRDTHTGEYTAITYDKRGAPHTSHDFPMHDGDHAVREYVHKHLATLMRDYSQHRDDISYLISSMRTDNLSVCFDIHDSA